MHILFALLAIVLMAAAIAAAVWTRIQWSILASNHRRRLVSLSGLCLIVYALELTTHWHSASLSFNEAQSALTVGSYASLALSVSLLRPKWLTSICSCLLFLFVPIAFLYFSLIFCCKPAQKQSIGDDFYVTKVRWDAGAMGSSGTNLLIMYQPHYLPFMARDVNWVRFDDTKCNSERAFLTIQPDHKHVLARCPWFDYQHKDGYHDFIVPLY